MLALPLTLRLLSSTKTTPPFCHEWCITERSSSHYHTQSQSQKHYHHLHHPKKKTPQHAPMKVRAQNHQVETGGERCDRFWCSSNTSHQMMVQMTTKINTHVLKLLHDVNKGDSGPRWGRRDRGGRGSRGRGCRICWGCICRLHTRSLCNKLHHTLPNRLLTNSTHNIEVRSGRDSNVHVGEDTRDSRRK